MRHSRTGIVGTALIAVLVVLSVIPVSAQSPTDLNALARYFPADTPIFVSLRTDDDFIETLDSVAARIRAVVPDAEGGTLAEALDELTGELFPGGTFEEDLRPLLGDTASVGIISTETLINDDRSDDDDTPSIVALSINNSQAVIDLLGRSEMRVEQTTGDGYTLFTPAEVEGGGNDDAIIVRDDVLLFYTTDTVMPEGGLPDGDLSGSADFTEGLAMLPEPTYNMTVYLDLKTFIDAAVQNDPEAAEAMETFGSVFNAVGSQVWGFTILGGDSPAIDIASQIGDISALEELGLSMGSMTPVDLAFAAHIPGNVPLALMGTDIKTSLSSAASSMMLAMPRSAESDFDPEEVEKSIEQLNQAFTQYTGLDFEQDVLSWMTGDYALFLSLNPAFDPTSQFGIFQAVPIDFGLVIEAADAAKAQATVAGLTQAIQTGVEQMSAANTEVETEATVTNETIGSADVTVVTITAENTPWPIEFLMGANDEVFALGTRAAVRAIFAPDGSLPANAEFMRTSPYILPNAISVGWLNTAGLLPLADLISTFGNDDEAEEEAEQARTAIGLFSSGTISSAYDEDGNSLARLVLTFSE